MSSASARAAEPLTVTRLPDAEKELLVTAASDKMPDGDGTAFSRAVSEELRLEQQAIQSSCRVAPTVSSPIAVRWAWEARCRYKRY